VILVDAGPLVALLSARDQHRQDCVRALRSLRAPLGTVWPAVTEAMHLLARSPRGREALLGQLQRESLGLLPLDRRDVPRIKELMHRYRDLPMDLADAALVRVAEREAIRTIFTVDRTDFEVYRLFGRRKFRIIP
jgi:predicted nucleic acid-binding protein